MQEAKLLPVKVAGRRRWRPYRPTSDGDMRAALEWLDEKVGLPVVRFHSSRPVWGECFLTNGLLLGSCRRDGFQAGVYVSRRHCKECDVNPLLVLFHELAHALDPLFSEEDCHLFAERWFAEYARERKGLDV